MAETTELEAVLQLDEREDGASEADRLRFLTGLIQSSHALLASCPVPQTEKTVKRRVRKILRVAIFGFWEIQKQKKYAAGRMYSIAARQFIDSSDAIKRNNLRYDHAIPMRMVIDELLAAHDKPRKIRLILDRIEARLITVEEDKAMNRLFRDKMPKGWTSEQGAVDARYQEAGIKFS